MTEPTLIHHWTFHIGESVVLARRVKMHDAWRGYIIAREIYQAQSGPSEFVYVRWIKPDGELVSEPDRLHISEVVKENPHA